MICAVASPRDWDSEVDRRGGQGDTSSLLKRLRLHSTLRRDAAYVARVLALMGEAGEVVPGDEGLEVRLVA